MGRAPSNSLIMFILLNSHGPETFVATCVLQYVRGLYTQSIKPMIDFISTPPRDIRAMGRWVILSNVIGNPSGEAFARHAAEAGCDLILLGRRSRKLDQFALDLDKLGYLGGARTRIKTIAWNERKDDIKDSSAFWIRVEEEIASATTDGGLALVVHCCSSRSNPSRPIMPSEGYSRRLISTALPKLVFRNQGAIVCISTTEVFADVNTYPDRNDLVDCSQACAAYSRQLIHSLHGKYRPLGIECLAASICVSWNDPLSCPPKSIFARMVLRFLVPPSAQTIVEASLKALGRQPELSPSESLFAQACRYSLQHEEKL